MTLFYNPAGPLVTYDAGLLIIENLNPEVSTHWRMSRSEMWKFGWHCIRAALSPSSPGERK